MHKNMPQQGDISGYSLEGEYFFVEYFLKSEYNWEVTSTILLSRVLFKLANVLIIVKYAQKMFQKQDIRKLCR